MRTGWNWLGVLPFFAFALLFLVLPTMNIVIGAFQTPQGGFTLANLAGLWSPRIVDSFTISIQVSLASAALGCLIGFAMAAAVVMGGFNLLSFWGLTLTYLFFQIPLMILIITPALEGLRREWREAAEVLGASTFQYWRMVALPILFPSLLGTFALLFANSFGAVATAYALTGSSLSIVPIMLFAQIRGDVLQDPHLGYAMAFGMIVITGLANLAYVVMRARAERWLR